MSNADQPNINQILSDLNSTTAPLERARLFTAATLVPTMDSNQALDLYVAATANVQAENPTLQYAAINAVTKAVPHLSNTAIIGAEDVQNLFEIMTGQPTIAQQPAREAVLAISLHHPTAYERWQSARQAEIQTTTPARQRRPSGLAPDDLLRNLSGIVRTGETALLPLQIIGSDINRSYQAAATEAGGIVKGTATGAAYGGTFALATAAATGIQALRHAVPPHPTVDLFVAAATIVTVAATVGTAHKLHQAVEYKNRRSPNISPLNVERDYHGVSNALLNYAQRLSPPRTRTITPPRDQNTPR